MRDKKPFILVGLQDKFALMNKRNSSTAGFTLIETLVAFAILGLVAGAVLSIFSTGPSKLSRAENQRFAVLTAQSVLALVGSERPLQTGTWQGGLAHGERWTLSIEP